MNRLRFCAVAAVLLLAVTAAGAHMGPGRVTVDLVTIHNVSEGSVEIWNTGKRLNANVDVGSKLIIQLTFTDEEEWRIHQVKAFSSPEPVPTANSGAPLFKQFDINGTFDPPLQSHTILLDLEDDIGFSWGDKPRLLYMALQLHLVKLDDNGQVTASEYVWAHAGNSAEMFGDPEDDVTQWGWWFLYEVAQPKSGHFIDAPVKGLSYFTPTHEGILGEPGGFQYFPGESVDFKIDEFYVGTAYAVPKVSPLDLFIGSDTESIDVIGVARTLQTLDSKTDGRSIVILAETATCFAEVADEQGFDSSKFGDELAVDAVLGQVVLPSIDGGCDGVGGVDLPEEPVSAAEAQATLKGGINASGIFRKNVSKTEDWAESKQKLDIMPVYFPGVRSNGDPSLCIDVNSDGLYTEGDDTLGVPYEEWRLNGDAAGEECDPRLDDGTMDPNCVLTIIDCREIAKPIIVTYEEDIDIHDDQVNVDFYDGRFAADIYTAVSRDDGTTFKRMNVSRMADLSSFELETGEPFHGTCRGPVQKVDDNQILVAWTSTFCKSGNPRYAITKCDDPDTLVEETPETGCAVYCSGNPDNGTEVCEPDYPYDDDYFVTDIWGVRGQQRSVNYDEVDDVADLGIGEIPYSCLWTARGVIVSQKELDAGTFASLTNIDDNGTPDDPSDDVVNEVELGDIVWYKPERLTSGRRDAFFVVEGGARGAGFAIAWQEDPDGLRPGKGKGPGQGWSGSKTNHKGDIWYSYISSEDFAKVDANFASSGPSGGTDAEPTGEEGNDEANGLGRPKPLVPFSLPVRITDNDMVNTDTLKVELSNDCQETPGSTEETAPVCFPEVVDGSFVPLDPDTMANLFCDGPDPVENCCDHDNHDTDPNCEDLEGLYGNLNGTKRYAYLAKTLDEIDNATGLHMPGGDGVPDYKYYVGRGGTLDLCDTSGTNSYMDVMPGTSAHERWFGFTNVSGQSKLVCVSSDGRLLDGDVSASRPNIQMQPYTKKDGTKSAWVLLAYEETKGMGHSLAAEEHDQEDIGDEIIGETDPDSGQLKPIKQDLGKNVVYHSFDFTQPDLVAPGHIVNLPALCGGLYPTYCDDPKTPDVIETNLENPTCTCVEGQPVPLYFDYEQCADETDRTTCEWLPDATKFLQYRTEIARRVRFIAQSYPKIGSSRLAAAIIFKQGQEGQGRPADVFIRRVVVPTVVVDPVTGLERAFSPKTDNPFDFANFECKAYLDETFDLPGCPTDGVQGYNCNLWGEAYGDRLCGGIITDAAGNPRRDHVNLTSANVDLAVDAGPVDDTPEDPTDDRYGTNKVLLWSQHEHNLGNESFGTLDGAPCDHLDGGTCPGMYSNAKSHRGFIRGDFLVTAYGQTPNWAAARNGRDRYNFYTRRSFDGGQTWTTTPAGLGGSGINYCREWRTEPAGDDEDGTGNAPPAADPALDPPFDPLCVDFCAPCPDGETCDCSTALSTAIAAGAFEPAKKVSQFDNNKETSSDPRIGATPPTYPLDGTYGTIQCPTMGAPGEWECIFPEDEWVDNVFFVAWGAGDNLKSTGGTTETPEAPPTDVYYTRTEDYGDHFLRIPWEINGTSSNYADETVWRYDYLAHGEPEEQGECQLRATADGSKMYAIWHSMIPEPVVLNPDGTEPELTRWYPWEPETSFENDVWFRRVIFWPDELTTPEQP